MPSNIPCSNKLFPHNKSQITQTKITLQKSTKRTLRLNPKYSSRPQVISGDTPACFLIKNSTNSGSPSSFPPLNNADRIALLPENQMTDGQALTRSRRLVLSDQRKSLFAICILICLRALSRSKNIRFCWPLLCGSDGLGLFDRCSFDRRHCFKSEK